jgi:hypothetical protein
MSRPSSKYLNFGSTSASYNSTLNNLKFARIYLPLKKVFYGFALKSEIGTFLFEIRVI